MTRKCLFQCIKTYSLIIAKHRGVVILIIIYVKWWGHNQCFFMKWVCVVHGAEDTSWFFNRLKRENNGLNFVLFETWMYRLATIIALVSCVSQLLCIIKFVINSDQITGLVWYWGLALGERQEIWQASHVITIVESRVISALLLNLVSLTDT